MKIKPYLQSIGNTLKRKTILVPKNIMSSGKTHIVYSVTKTYFPKLKKYNITVSKVLPRQ